MSDESKTPPGMWDIFRAGGQPPEKKNTSSPEEPVVKTPVPKIKADQDSLPPQDPATTPAIHSEDPKLITAQKEEAREKEKATETTKAMIGQGDKQTPAERITKKGIAQHALGQMLGK